MPSKGHALDAEDCRGGPEERNEGEEEPFAVYCPSNVPGVSAVNALTGMPYPFKAGSLESLQLFKVIDATGTVGRTGQPAPRGKGASDPNQLLYNGPQEYLDQRGTGPTLPDSVMAEWERRQNAIYREGVFDRGRALEYLRASARRGRAAECATAD